VPTSPKKATPQPIRPVTITGARGDWIADVGGERLAVIHDTHWSGKDVYRDPMTGVDVATKRYVEYVQKLRESDRVVVQRDKGQGSLERDGYVGVFSFKDLQVDPEGPIEMRLTARVANARK
jgi:predicted xylose isomerase-like sugar epimerase